MSLADRAPHFMDRKLALTSLVVVLGSFMTILDTTIVNVAIDSLSREFKTDLTTIQWITTGYLLALATVIPLTGNAFHSGEVWQEIQTVDGVIGWVPDRFLEYGSSGE